MADMNNPDPSDEDTDTQTPPPEETPSGMRKQIAKLAKENAALSKDNAAFKAKDAKAEREAILIGKGYKPEAVEFVPEDGWTNPRLLDEFLAERAWLAQEARQTAIDKSDAAASEARIGLSADQSAAFAAIQKVGAVSGDSTVDLSALQAQIKGCKNESELNALMAQYQLS